MKYYNLKLFLLAAILLSFSLSGCMIKVKHGVHIPLVGTFYDYSYLASLEGGKLGEPLADVVIEDEEKAIELYGSLEEARTFESYFPDDIKAGKKLDNWWKSPLKSFYPNKYIVKTIRNGFRRTKQDKPQILRWMYYRYGSPFSLLGKESLKAYWLRYYASFSPEENVRESAVSWGIGWHAGGDVGLISQRLIQLAIEDEKYSKYTVRVANSGRGPIKGVFIEYLQPYLNNTDPEIQNKAKVLEHRIEENLR